MPERKKAFLSYAHRYQPWVKILHGNLVASLREEVFLYDVDLASGRSWIGQLQAGRDWREKTSTSSSWSRHRFPRSSPRSRPWTSGRPARRSTAAVFRRSGLLGQPNQRNLPLLPAGIEIPAPPDPGLPAGLRSRLVLEPLLGKRVLRSAIASWLRLAAEKLEGQPSTACAASAAWSGRPPPRTRSPPPSGSSKPWRTTSRRMNRTGSLRSRRCAKAEPLANPLDGRLGIEGEFRAEPGPQQSSVLSSVPS
jgi:hypothetical protein